MPVESTIAELQEALTADFIDRHASEAARILEDLDLAEAVEMLEAGSDRVAARLVERTNPDWAAQLLQAINPEKLVGIAGLLDL